MSRKKSPRTTLRSEKINAERVASPCLIHEGLRTEYTYTCIHIDMYVYIHTPAMLEFDGERALADHPSFLLPFLLLLWVGLAPRPASPGATSATCSAVRQPRSMPPDLTTIRHSLPESAAAGAAEHEGPNTGWSCRRRRWRLAGYPRSRWPSAPNGSAAINSLSSWVGGETVQRIGY